MPIELKLAERQELKPKITVFGVGGAGGNAVNNMIEKELAGADFVAANTDSQALEQSKADRRIQLGAATTQGLGAGANPEIGASAAEESMQEIIDVLSGSHMCFITAGMGGGTGTGAAPVIARAAREMGVLTVGVVTKPFAFEGSKRMRLAESGIGELQKYVDTLIIIPNQNLFRIANEKTTFADAFVMADDVLYQGVKGVTDLMVRPGIVNLDFADVRAVMNEMGKAMMGSGEGSGENRALDAAEKAIANPLLDEVSLKGARGVLINITGGSDLTLFEVDEAANRVRKEADDEAAVFFGSALDPDMEGSIRVSVVATGIDAESFKATRPTATPKVETQPTPRAPEPVEAIVAPPPAPAATPSTPPPALAAPTAPAPAPAPAPRHVIADDSYTAPPGSFSATERTPAGPTGSFHTFVGDRSFGADDFETPRGFHDPLTAVEPAIVGATARAIAPIEDPSPQRELVEKMSRTPSRATSSDWSSKEDEARVQIPSFLRRQAN